MKSLAGKIAKDLSYYLYFSKKTNGEEAKSFSENY
jgi:hypothetical protein